MTTSHQQRSIPRRSRRGSVLIVALLIAGIIGISLASYIQLCTNSLKQANRSFLANTAGNLAEIGLEEALYCFNQLDDTTVTLAWNGWNANAATHEATKTFAFDADFLGQNSTGEVKVYVNGYDGTNSSPVAVAQATVNLATGGGPPIVKIVEISLRKRSLFSNGLVAKDTITWVGHPTADSWNSNPSPGSIVPYAVAVRTANCTLGSVNGSIDLGSGGNVYGYSKTGTSGTTSGGSVHGVGTTTNDPTRISSDFSATFPPIVVPVPDVSYNVIGTVPAAFPVAGHLAASDSRYYYVFAGGTAISDSVAITGNVTFLMNSHNGVSAMSFTGSKALTINSGASLVLYTNGDIDTHGNALMNNNVQPETCVIYGTNTSVGGQTITVGGNGQLIAAVYAPNSTLTLQGGGSSGNVSGSFVGSTVRMTGGTDFHYDEALGDFSTGNPFGISKWRELQSATERGLYAEKLNF